MYQGISAS